MPAANHITIVLMALIAEDEAERISSCTKAALAAAKTRGKKPNGFLPPPGGFSAN